MTPPNSHERRQSATRAAAAELWADPVSSTPTGRSAYGASGRAGSGFRPAESTALPVGTGPPGHAKHTMLHPSSMHVAAHATCRVRNHGYQEESWDLVDVGQMWGKMAEKTDH